MRDDDHNLKKTHTKGFVTCLVINLLFVISNPLKDILLKVKSSVLQLDGP